MILQEKYGNGYCQAALLFVLNINNFPGIVTSTFLTHVKIFDDNDTLFSHLSNSHYRRELRREFNIPGVNPPVIFNCPTCSVSLKSTNYYSHIGSKHQEYTCIHIQYYLPFCPLFCSPFSNPKLIIWIR